MQSATFANLSFSVPQPAPRRSCHGQSRHGHWQCPSTTTTVDSAMKRELRGAADASLTSANSRSGARARTARASAAKDASTDGTQPLPLSTAPAAAHAAAHAPAPSLDERDGSPGASSSGGRADGPGVGLIADTHAAVEVLKAELLDMRKQAAAQAALTAQQALTISSLERTLQKTQEGGSAQPAGQGTCFQMDSFTA